MLLWFRNDIRIHDNPALHYCLSACSVSNGDSLNNTHHSSVIQALFFVSKKQWLQHHWSPIKIDLLLRHVHWLKDQLTALNIELTIVEADDFEQQINYLKTYCQQHHISEVVANSEVEFNEHTRDQACIAQGIPLTLFEADVIVPKGTILNQSGYMFKVFTPFKRAWLAHVKQMGFTYLGNPLSNPTSEPYAKTAESNEEPLNSASSSWPLITVIERQVIPTFLREKLHDYQAHRDFPAIKGTSGLSPYLAIGALSPRYLLIQLLNKHPDILTATDDANFTWLNELIWREFYRHLLFHHPDLSKHQCFNSKYQKTQWPNNPEYFNAWCQGKTGYPIVDAAMKQLTQTGWMHNRLRMIVASFLTKHLLVDWRWGEQFFMEHLIDGDLAANNGGWQWAASTGCDAQPYFRIFNPIRQSERFDPEGTFIRTYIPELNDVPNKAIHFPHAYLKQQEDEEKETPSYWPAIVEHKQARLEALSFYK